MGSSIGRLILQKPGLRLCGAVGRRKERAGSDLGAILGLEEDLGIRLSADLEEVLAAAKPEVAIQATCSRVSEAHEELRSCIEHRVNVISLAEEMSYPWHAEASLAQSIHELAARRGVTVLGTGVNPGFVLDYLVIALTGVCLSVRSIRATRINDLSPYGPSVLRSQGVGLTPEEFERGVEEGTVAGHFGFGESVGMIARALGWKIDRIEETRRPIVSRAMRQTPAVVVQPGRTAGCEQRAVAYCGAEPVITLVHPQQVHPHLEGVATGDRIEISGIPDICFESRPEIPGGLATTAIAVNMIPHVLAAEPGLVTMADLPAPAAMMGDVRDLMATRFAGRAKGALR
jgi:4-hydroxy-tetrahydrodipicolinate reductase